MNMLSKEEKRKTLKEIYSNISEEIEVITNSKAEDIRIEEITYGENDKVNEVVVSFLLKKFDKFLHSLPNISPAYERVYKKINLNDLLQIKAVLVFEPN
jgi:hypothetical protein